MATAVQELPVTEHALGVYRCACGHRLRVFGGGRHRIYFEPANLLLDDPVMNGVCPNCGRGLPGKSAS
jgi:hypothetical protein